MAGHDDQGPQVMLARVSNAGGCNFCIRQAHPAERVPDRSQQQVAVIEPRRGDGPKLQVRACWRCAVEIQQQLAGMGWGTAVVPVDPGKAR